MIKKTKQMYMQMLISRIGWSPIWNQENTIEKRTVVCGIYNCIFYKAK